VAGNMSIDVPSCWPWQLCAGQVLVFLLLGLRCACLTGGWGLLRTQAQRYSHGVRLAKAEGLDSELVNLALQVLSTPWEGRSVGVGMQAASPLNEHHNTHDCWRNSW
jgi:hypothetical protein